MKIKYQVTVEEEDIPVRGNVLASGDEANDRAEEDRILAALERGNVFEWCWARVLCTVEKDGRRYEGDASLGGISCSGEADFNETILPELKNEAFAAAVEVYVADVDVDEMDGTCETPAYLGDE